jgi:hypothetical protein
MVDHQVAMEVRQDKVYIKRAHQCLLLNQDTIQGYMALLACH